MKNLSFLLLVTVMAFGVASCGNKDKDSSSSTFSSDPYKVSTVSGYLDTVQPIVIVGNTTYQISQNSYQIMAQAFQRAQQAQPPIQPAMVNGSYRYKAKITGSLASGYQQQAGVQSGYPQQQVGNTLNVSAAVIYR
jgi:hypothetical protein